MNFELNTNSTSDHDKYDVVSPTECWQLNIVAGYCIALFMSSFMANITILWAFIRDKKLRTPINMFVMYFTIMSLIGSCSEFPFIIPTNLKCR